MLNNFISTAARGFSAAKHFVKCKSPEILLVTGVAGIVAGVVSACKATRKVDTIKKETEEIIEKCENSVGKPCEDGTIYSEKDRDIDISNEKIFNGLRIVKTYALPAIIIAGGIGSIIFSHKILRDRLDGLAKAYSLVSSAYALYRDRVKQQYGQEIENDIYTGRGIDKDFIDKANNCLIENDEESLPRPASAYCWTFDATSPYWTGSNALNASFIIRTRNMLNQQLWTKGCIYLEDVLDAFGIQYDEKDRTMVRICGWMMGVGDEAIDLGKDAEDFIKGVATSRFDSAKPINITLDFNCSGDILHRPFTNKAAAIVYGLD